MTWGSRTEDATDEKEAGALRTPDDNDNDDESDNDDDGDDDVADEMMMK